MCLHRYKDVKLTRVSSFLTNLFLKCFTKYYFIRTFSFTVFGYTMSKNVYSTFRTSISARKKKKLALIREKSPPFPF